jgi:hypothetical protein
MRTGHYLTPHVVLVDHPGSGADGVDLAKLAGVLQRQVQHHFGPFWNVSCTVGALSAGLSPALTDWVIGLFRDPDQPGALGYHDTTAAGLPLAKVFPLLDKQDGSDLSVTISHELLEMLADPYLTRCVQSPLDGKFWALEVCDAVENDVYTFDGIALSNFVTPHYFEPPQDLTGIALDYLTLVKRPYEVRPGGYMQWYGNGGWHQVVHDNAAPRAYRTTNAGRIKHRSGRAFPTELDKKFAG